MGPPQWLGQRGHPLEIQGVRLACWEACRGRLVLHRLKIQGPPPSPLAPRKSHLPEADGEVVFSTQTRLAISLPGGTPAPSTCCEGHALTPQARWPHPWMELDIFLKEKSKAALVNASSLCGLWRAHSCHSDSDALNGQGPGRSQVAFGLVTVCAEQAVPCSAGGEATPEGPVCTGRC